MTVQKLKSFLDEKNIRYVSVKHSNAYTAQEVAATSHVSGREFAKTVIINREGKLIMCVLPASYKVDFGQLKANLGSENIALAGEAEFKKADPGSLSGDEVKEQLLKSGLWPFIKQRPYGIIASPEKKPRAIFVSTFDTAPLAPDVNFVLDGKMSTFQTGIDALAKLTDGEVFLGVNENSPFAKVKNATVRQFTGPHPAGNVGVQIHHISPVIRGEVVWTVNVHDVLFIGRLFETGKVDFRGLLRW